MAELPLTSDRGLVLGLQIGWDAQLDALNLQLSREAEAPATIYEVRDSEDDRTDDETDGSVNDSVACPYASFAVALAHFA
ncbi:hypothetical protein PSPO01_16146 [Paraphaeosphaeria sporulosa]